VKIVIFFLLKASIRAFALSIIMFGSAVIYTQSIKNHGKPIDTITNNALNYLMFFKVNNWTYNAVGNELIMSPKK